MIASTGEATIQDASFKPRRLTFAAVGVLRRHMVLVGGMIGLLILLIGAAQIALARASLNNAASDLSAAIRLARNGEGLAHVDNRQAIELKIRASHTAFTTAESDLWMWSPLLSHVGWIPGIGHEAEAAYPLAATGEDATAGALDLLHGLSPVWHALKATAGQSTLARLAPALFARTAYVHRAESQFGDAQLELKGVPLSLGNRQIDGQVARLRRALPILSTTARWLALSPRLLGASSPSHFLLVWENPDQIRPSGGFIPAANFIAVTRGQIKTRSFGSFFAPRDPIPVPAPEAMYTGEGSLLFEDSNWSPDFPLSARYERWMFGAATGLQAPMVIDVNEAGPILEATGPVFVQSYRRWVNDRNVGYWIEHYHLLYVRHTQIHASDTKSQRFLAALFLAITRKVEHLGARGLLRLAAGFHRAISDQALLMYSQDPSVEAAIISAGADGRIGPVPHDSMLVVDYNLSYGKINPYISESARYDVTISKDLRVTGLLRLTYHNRPSPANLYSNGPFDARNHKHAYQDWVRVYVPAVARVRTETGVAGCSQVMPKRCFWRPLHAYGMTELGVDVLVPEGKTRTFAFRYILPSAIFHTSGTGRYLLTIDREPSSNLRSIRVDIHVQPGMSIASAGSRSRDFRVALRSRATTLEVPLFGATGSPPAMRLSHGPWSDPWLPNYLFDTPYQVF